MAPRPSPDSRWTSSTPGRQRLAFSPSATNANTSPTGRLIETECSADGMAPMRVARRGRRRLARTLPRMAWLTDTDRRLIALTWAVKLGVLLVGAIAYVSFRNVAVNSPDDILRMWSHWDAPHYLDLVVFGYRDGDSSSLVGPNGYRSIYPEDLALYIVFYPLLDRKST